MPFSFRQPPRSNWHKISWINCLFFFFMLYVAWKRGPPLKFARFVLFRPIIKRSFNLLCVLDLFSEGWQSTLCHIFLFWNRFESTVGNRPEDLPGTGFRIRRGMARGPSWDRFDNMAGKNSVQKQVWEYGWESARRLSWNGTENTYESDQKIVLEQVWEHGMRMTRSSSFENRAGNGQNTVLEQCWEYNKMARIVSSNRAENAIRRPEYVVR